MYGALDHTRIPNAKCSANLMKKMKNPFMTVIQKDLKIFNIEENRFRELASNGKKFNDLIRRSKVEANGEKWIKQKEEETRVRRRKRQEEKEQEEEEHQIN
jgi:hypothetical protein